MTKRIIIIVALLGVLLLSVAALVMAKNFEDKLNSGHEIINETQREKNTTKAEAIKQAKDWSPPPDQMCTMAMTPAVHTETGAKYTFPSGCLAPGWELARQKQDQDDL